MPPPAGSWLTSSIRWAFENLIIVIFSYENNKNLSIVDGSASAMVPAIVLRDKISNTLIKAEMLNGLEDFGMPLMKNLKFEKVQKHFASFSDVGDF